MDFSEKLERFIVAVTIRERFPTNDKSKQSGPAKDRENLTPEIVKLGDIQRDEGDAILGNATYRNALMNAFSYSDNKGELPEASPHLLPSS